MFSTLQYMLSGAGVTGVTGVTEVTEVTGASSNGGYSLTPIVVSAGIALVLMLAYRVLQHTLTMAHEGGHAAVGVLMGGQVGSIRMSPGGGGVTSIGMPGWFADVLTTSAGYLAPSVFGLLGVLLLETGNPAAVLWVTIALLAVMLIVARGWFTVPVVILFGAALFLVARYGAQGVQEIVAITWVWWLLLGGFVDSVVLMSIVRSGSTSDDASVLRRRTMLPARFWVLVFQAGTLFALTIGGRALFSMAS
jgi:hypothetical protein